MDRFISDLHLGDIKYVKKRGFKTKKDMHKHIVEEWNKVCNNDDRIFLLGDVAKKPKYYPILEQLNGNIYVILGNHDEPKFIPELIKYVKGVSGLYKYINDIYLTHAPVHECQIGIKTNLNIHGHLHKQRIVNYNWDYINKKDIEIINTNYINVCLDMIGYRPMTLFELTNNKEFS